MGNFLMGQGPEAEMMPMMAPGQWQALGKLGSILGGQLGKGIKPYKGQMVAEASPLQEQIFGLTQELLGRTGPEQAQEYWEKTFKAPAMETWQKDIMPMIREKSIAAGTQYSSGHERALAEAGGRFGTGLTGQLADILFRQEQGLPGMYQTLMGVGGTQRGIEQQKLGAEFERWRMKQPWANPWLSQLQTLLGARGWDYAVMPGQQGFLQSLFGGFGGGLGAMLGSRM